MRLRWWQIGEMQQQVVALGLRERYIDVLVVQVDVDAQR